MFTFRTLKFQLSILRNIYQILPPFLRKQGLTIDSEMPEMQANTTTTKKECASAAIIVIGDEILKGQIQDANTIFLTKVIYQRVLRTKSLKIRI